MRNIKGLLIPFLFIFISSCKISQKHTGSDNQNPLFTIDSINVYPDEFIYAYEKSNKNKGTVEPIEEYLDLYIDFKLKVLEAKARGLDSTVAYLNELSGYLEEIKKPYLTTEKVNKELVQEAYERLQMEINASHILITVKEDAKPEDTLIAYQKIKKIQQAFESGESFEALAKKYSQDPSATRNNGLLGWFTAFQMVYPFESAAYQTEVGEISPIIRTQFGYHLLKVNEKRETLGRIKIAHIMKRYPPGASSKDSIQTENAIKKIANQLKEGENWFILATNESQDISTKDKGGSLPWFGAGDLPSSLETVAFELQEKGDISQPVKSPYGWHILKLEDKRGVGSLQSMRESLSRRVQRDQRSELKDAQVIQKLKVENDFSKNKESYKLLSEKEDLSPENFRKKELNATLFSISKTNYTIEDFLRTSDNSIELDLALQNYEKSKLIEYEEQNLEIKYPEYRFLRKEYKEGLLLFEIMNQEVWSKVGTDTTGLRNFYNNNQNNYQTKEQIQVAKIVFSDTSRIKHFKKPIKNAYFPLGDSLKYENAIDFKEQVKKYDSIENELHLAVSLPKNLSKKDSIQLFKDINQTFPDKEVLSLTYSNENKIYLQLLSQANDLLAKLSNGIASASTEIIELENSAKWNSNVKGEYQRSVTESGMIELLYLVKKQPQRQQTFEEAKPQLMEDYQQQLEKEWVIELKQKYKVNIDTSELKKIKTEIEK